MRNVKAKQPGSSEGPQKGNECSLRKNQATPNLVNSHNHKNRAQTSDSKGDGVKIQKQTNVCLKLELSLESKVQRPLAVRPKCGRRYRCS